MKLGIHLRKISEYRDLPNIADHLVSLYEREGDDIQPLGRDEFSVDEIYVGDEFCPMRMPSPKQLATFSRFSTERTIGLTLLVPVLTDAWMDHLAPLFECLEKWYPEAGVVANDIGTILFLRQNHPGFHVSMGRLFNKGFKDPRLSTKDSILTAEGRRLLSESTFDHAVFGAVMARLTVRGLVRDLLPYCDGIPNGSTAYQSAYYFPFGYVTTGRVCRTAAFGKRTEHDFAMINQCAKPCNGLSFRLKSDAVSLNLIQAGNTIFYLYPPPKLMGLVEKAAEENHRLIYQGFAI